MTSEYQINALILDTIDEHCSDAVVKELIKKAMQFEMDMYHRKPARSVIETEYSSIINRLYRGKQE